MLPLRALRRWARGARRRDASPRSTANAAFGARIRDRVQWLFDTLPREAAEYQSDILTKESQKRLARRLGLPVAEEYLVRVPLDEAMAYVERMGLERFVIKPNWSHSANGCRGVVKRGDVFVNVHTGRAQSLRSLTKEVRREYAKRGRPDEWVLEELLMPADGSFSLIQDYKFYCFGGVTEVILHKWPVAGPDGWQRNWYARDWSPVDVSIKGPGHGAASAPLSGERLVAMAEEAASSLCYPFIRIDLYDTTRGVVLGEFTPGPGSIATFDDASSERFLALWEQAAANTTESIRNGSRRPLTRPEARVVTSRAA